MLLRLSHILSAIAFLSSVAFSTATASVPFPAADDETYTDELPLPRTATGLEPGEAHWLHHEIIGYLDELAAASDRMVRLDEVGASVEGRPLPVYAISTPRNISRLNQIRAQRGAITSPETASDRNERNGSPVVVYAGYSIHGDESGPANATPSLAWFLCAVDDPAWVETLSHQIILIDPCMNPDGLDRFAQWSRSLSGRVHNADPNDLEHQQDFPTGRVSSYWFDLNRDWLVGTHPETRHRLQTFLAWNPTVFLDFHEMSTGSTFFFQPGEPERVNPWIPAENQQITQQLTSRVGEAFDRASELHFSGERFDDFFPGKSSTYTDLQGAIGILFEQASSRGMQQERPGGVLTFRDTIAAHFRASLAAFESIGQMAPKLHRYQTDFFADSHADGRRVGGVFLVSDTGYPQRLQRFEELLQQHGIRTERLAETLSVDGVTYRAGRALRIPASQSRYRLLSAIMEMRTAFDERVFYDVSTANLPVAFGFEFTPAPVKPDKSAVVEPSDPEGSPGSLETDAGAIGWLIDWRDDTAPGLVHDLLNEGASCRVAMDSFVLERGSRTIQGNRGDVFVKRPADDRLEGTVIARLQHDINVSGARIHAVRNSVNAQGIDIGGPDFLPLVLPKVLMLTGPGVSQTAAGSVWHLFDNECGIPLTRVDLAAFGSVRLQDYTHLILSHPAEAKGYLMPAQIEQLQAFLRSGGTIIALQGAASMLAQIPGFGLELRAYPGAADPLVKNPKRRLPFASALEESAWRSIPGAVLAGMPDHTHPLCFGIETDTVPLMRQHEVFVEPGDLPFGTPIVYGAEPLLSGFVPEDFRSRIEGAAAARVHPWEGGKIILILDDPTFRGFWLGTNKLLLNAVFFDRLMGVPERFRY